MPCRVPKRRFSCGAPQHLTKNLSFYRKLFLIKYILKDSFFQKVLKYCSICVTKGL